MAENCTRKLIVEICNAKNLMPKDGQETASAYAIVDFNGQRRRTKTKFRDLNPVWDEKVEFLVHDIESIGTEILEINLYNDKKIGKRSNFLGKVKLAGNAFVKAGDETLVYYPLEKRSVFSQIKGEIGVKVFYVDEEAPPALAEAAMEQKAEKAKEKPPENPKLEEDKKEEKKVEEKKEEEGKKEEEKPKEEAPKEEEKANPPPAESSNSQDAIQATAPVTTPPPAEVENPPLTQKKESPTKVGTQADEAFQEAWQSNSGGLTPETRAKVYLSPKLWYLRLTVIQTQDLQLGLGSEAKVRNPELYVKAQLGAQHFKTGRTQVGSAWNEDLVFVAAEPFEPVLVVTVEDASNERSVVQAKSHVASIKRRTDDKVELKSRWFNLVGGEN
ncbi:hypothetical protein PTKIN_Ptkin06aG0148700 [Pterospermum kingtungense]